MKKLTIAISLGLLTLLFSVPVRAESLLFEKSEYAARRAKFMQEIPDGMAIILGLTSVPQHNDFTYLCGVDVPGAILIVDGNHQESILLYTTSEPYLKGEGLSPELATSPLEATGIEKYYPIDQFSSVLTGLLGKTDVIYTLFKNETSESEVSTSSEWDGRLTRQLQFVKLLGESYPGLEVKDCSEILWEQRRIKTAAEIEAIREAGRIGAQFR